MIELEMLRITHKRSLGLELPYQLKRFIYIVFVQCNHCYFCLVSQKEKEGSVVLTLVNEPCICILLRTAAKSNLCLLGFFNQ